jgi:SAM-dependent methyltransferase
VTDRYRTDYLDTAQLALIANAPCGFTLNWVSRTAFHLEPRSERIMGQPETRDTGETGARKDASLGDRNMMALLGMINGYWISQVVRAAADLRLADHLAAGALTAGEVAGLESSDPSTTYRLMRACAGLGLLSYDNDGRFTVTPMGVLLQSGVPGSLRDHALVFGAPGHWLPWGQLPEAVRKGGTQAADVLGADLFDYLGGQPEEAAQFAASMEALTAGVAAGAARVVDVSGVSLAVDVGGGTGELVRELMRANDGLRGMVLDLPQAAAAAQQAAEAEGLGSRFSGVGGDFFTEVPAADLYLLKAILHDWDDDSCVRILRNCREAARPGGRVVVIENVIRDPARDRFAALLDMNMLAVTSGQEREVAEYDALFAASGWQRAAVHPLPGARSLLELHAIG